MALVLSRKLNETIIINDNIEVTVLEINRGQVRIGINAPKEVKILRSELIERDQEVEKAS